MQKLEKMSTKHLGSYIEKNELDSLFLKLRESGIIVDISPIRVKYFPAKTKKWGCIEKEIKE
ncbi:hypothetical protein [Helicobacter pylori]|uniref:hypothetical protein n=1 Tax=Helicobacter pylori TaxID=210 RepID=UPI001FD70986|nr:hypothetical protein [Helicobacter pylori]UOR60691.1 hypothetical protein MPG38_07835 [Helicobacter pylori]